MYSHYAGNNSRLSISPVLPHCHFVLQNWIKKIEDTTIHSWWVSIPLIKKRKKKTSEEVATHAHHRLVSIPLK